MDVRLSMKVRRQRAANDAAPTTAELAQPVSLGRQARRARPDHPALDGTRSQLRLERLAAELRTKGPATVVSTSVRAGGERLRLRLAGEAVLRLRLYWPREEPVAALESLRWDERIGWVVVVRTAGGRRIDYAWLAVLDEPPDAPCDAIRGASNGDHEPQRGSSA
jgi:hypothetical protein